MWRRGCPALTVRVRTRGGGEAGAGGAGLVGRAPLEAPVLELLAVRRLLALELAAVRLAHGHARVGGDVVRHRVHAEGERAADEAEAMAVTTSRGFS